MSAVGVAAGFDFLTTEESRGRLDFAGVGVGGLLVADQSVRPTIGDFNFELVFTSLERIADLDTPRGTPDDAEVFAVELHARQAVHGAEVQEYFGFWIF